MAQEEKLILTPKKFKADKTSIVSARVSTDLLKKIDDLARKTNRNRNEIISILLSFAVDRAEINATKEED